MSTSTTTGRRRSPRLQRQRQLQSPRHVLGIFPLENSDCDHTPDASDTKSPAVATTATPSSSSSSNQRKRQRLRAQQRPVESLKSSATQTVPNQKNNKNKYNRNRNRNRDHNQDHDNHNESSQVKENTVVKGCNPSSVLAIHCLGRPLEDRLLVRDPNHPTTVRYVMGVDEAGRGPIAGPVVAAAAVVPTNLPGITDSKAITCEATRERLYQSIVSSHHVRWAVAIVDAPTIDRINILQATLLGMRMAVQALIIEQPSSTTTPDDDIHTVRVVSKPCASITGCYVTRGMCASFLDNNNNGLIHAPDQVFALIDGNKIPAHMPCSCQSVIKGDSTEYSIAAASILAKVTRDRLMHQYAHIYPAFSHLSVHKGYPTAAHRTAVQLHGASAIHRRSFAPLKYMDLDADGRIIVSSSFKKKNKIKKSYKG